MQICLNRCLHNLVYPLVERKQVIIVGAGMAGLTAACRLVKAGFRVQVFEQNYLPGGCTSSYWRKGFVFESGATTLVGLDKGMPLRQLFDDCGITIEAWKLDKPMEVRLGDQVIKRHPNLEDWILEAEQQFGPKGQRSFWTEAKKIADFVWATSLKQLRFPPEGFKDLLAMAANANIDQLRHLPYAFKTTDWLLAKHGLGEHKEFKKFVNEQLIITAQNHAEEVNCLFGATALCYTMVGNYYVPGGLLNLVQPMVDYINQNGGVVWLRQPVGAVNCLNKKWFVELPKGVTDANDPAKPGKTENSTSDILLFAVPLNNVLEFLPALADHYKSQLLPSEKLASAFQVGIGFKPHKPITCLHHQIHKVSGGSIFISFSHPDDHERADQPGLMVANVSTHLPNPENLSIDKEGLVEQIKDILEEADLILPENIVYLHASGPKDWAKWTRRKWGFVGGYPQFKSIKPWQMVGHKLPIYGGWICGDTTYPGQGIPGACLSGLISAEKIIATHS